ncbi:hypothetical protein K438DRAFT_1765430 [Mycena galopus ATCC 62051]|nr:hypothetical protein K438DRAFT_1765430 [Mycena galopus ATCC 62051]
MTPCRLATNLPVTKDSQKQPKKLPSFHLITRIRAALRDTIPTAKLHARDTYPRGADSRAEHAVADDWEQNYYYDLLSTASKDSLAAAFALKSAGHTVLVLEKELQLGGTGTVPNSGCARMPPNGSKILLDWGLESEVKANSAHVTGFSAYKCEPRYSYPSAYAGPKLDAEGQLSRPDRLGINRYDEEMLSEARGGYMQFRHRDLIGILHNLALTPSNPLPNGSSPSVSIIFGAEVVNVDCNACSVTLRSGEIYTADAIIGADGINGVVRQTLMKEEGKSTESDIPTGIAVYSATVPNILITEDDLGLFCDDLGCTIWVGPTRGLTTYGVGKENDISLSIYTPDNSQDGNWVEEAQKAITDILGPCDQQRVASVQWPRSQVKQHCELESWVSKSGRVLVVGEAAHPFPPCSGQAYAAALEDATFIGKIFSHAQILDLVPEFLRAFQEHRQVQPSTRPFSDLSVSREPRLTRIRQMEHEYIYYITLPDGDIQAMRDASIRANYAAGKNALEGDLQQMQEDLRMMFGYEAADDADEWWITWGRYHDTSASPGKQGDLFNVFSSWTQQVRDSDEGFRADSEEEDSLVDKLRIMGDLELK